LEPGPGGVFGRKGVEWIWAGEMEKKERGKKSVGPGGWLKPVVGSQEGRREK